MTDKAPDLADRRGTLGVGEDGQWQIRFQRRLRHAPERVWSALVDPAQQAAWVPGVTIEATVGGTVLFDFAEQGKAEGEVLAVEAPRLLEHTWLWPGEPSATVRWEVTADGDGTLLVLWHRPLRRDPAAGYAAGWHVMLDALETHLSGAVPGEPEFPRLFEMYREG
ncbi:hypothetical protein ALI144C_13750 [Actinosynnema sp. ALI-1.44]|uniref:SRPBCC family protein n=1 Tax=Actinosynnema sp. ALI-1.44 TaxID=1933779 RepID=UPI00097BD836|nr:SRPBCC family protein [Actinosynnema sp. ALI-1.44]ONI85352.1 hypothetical protein ALI144C_13750 [Actinosynnema sp. ALI-1.44]